MCGVAGVAAAAGERHHLGRLAWGMAAALAHRGPDGAGLYVDPLGRAALAHRRLAIVDLSPLGAEPVRSPEGRFTLVFNGEIYNACELRIELTRRGRLLRSRSDAEVVLALYAESGPACLERLRGMFAFAIWDEHRGELFLARDRLGEKPLYYAAGDGRLLFASELRGLTASGVLGSEIDQEAIVTYLALGSIPAPATVWRNVRALPPAACLHWRAGEVRVWRYWSPCGPAGIDPADTRSLRVRLAEVVGLRLVTERPCGVLLSGGIDSAAVMALAVAEGARPAAHTLVADGGDDEVAAAAAVARRFDLPHHLHLVSGGEVAADLDGILSTLDQPSVDGVNFSLLARATRHAGTVVGLSGIGGDEVFGGYPSGRRVEWLRRVGAHPSLRALLHLLVAVQARRHPFGRGAKPGYFFENTGSPLAAYLSVRGLFGPRGVEALAGKGATRDLEGALTPALWPGAASEDPAAIELALYTAGQLLRDADAVSMAHGLEVRSPFLDHALVEWLLAGGVHSGGAQKEALRSAVADLLPPEVLVRRKRPFTLPWEAWLRGALRAPVEEILRSESHEDPVPSAAALRLWQGFLDGRVHWSRPWAVAVLRRWCALERSGRTERPRTVPPPRWRAA